MSIAPERGGTMTETIAADLRQLIHDGELGPGERIGSVQDLAVRYGTGRTTVNAAIDRLEAEGLLSGGKGKLIRVRQALTPLIWDLGGEMLAARGAGPATAFDGSRWEAAVREQGRAPRQDAVALSLLGAPPPEAAGVAQWEGKTAVRSLIRRVDGQPSMLATSYFPYEVIAGTPLAEPGDAPATADVLADAGHPQAHLEWSASARMPRPREIADFRLPRGVPVLEVTLAGYGADGVPVHVMRIVAPADRWTIRVPDPALAAGHAQPCVISSARRSQ